MKPLLISLFLLLPCSQVFAGPSLETVLGMLRQGTIASNQGDIPTILKTLPAKGVSITHPTGETVTVDRKMMETYLSGYFKSMKPGSYLYGAKLCAVGAKDANTITVTLEISESYVLIEKDTPTSSCYREILTVGLENDQPVVLKAVMEKTEAKRIEAAEALPAGAKAKE